MIVYSPQSERGEPDAGFSLVELLVVMVIIGVLAVIAVPVFLAQQKKAHDSSTKADVTNLGKEVATYFIDGEGTLTLDFNGKAGYVLLTDGAEAAEVRLTNGTAAPLSGGFADLNDPKLWCVSLTDVKGKEKDFRYTALQGLEKGLC